MTHNISVTKGSTGPNGCGLAGESGERGAPTFWQTVPVLLAVIDQKRQIIIRQLQAQGQQVPSDLAPPFLDFKLFSLDASGEKFVVVSLGEFDQGPDIELCLGRRVALPSSRPKVTSFHPRVRLRDAISHPEILQQHFGGHRVAADEPEVLTAQLEQLLSS